MRRFLSVIGALALAGLVACGLGVAVLAHQGSQLDTESKAFVDEALPSIAAHWEESQLLDRATPELRASLKPGQLQGLFASLAKFGPLVVYEGSKGTSTMSYFAGSGTTITASYVAKAQFQNGAAAFKIILLKRDGRWRIHNFHVDRIPGNRSAQGV